MRLALALLLISYVCPIACSNFVIPSGISAQVGTGFDTQMADVSYYPSYYSGTTGSTYIFQLYSQGSTPSLPAIYLFSLSSQTSNTNLQGILTAGAIKQVASTVIIEAKKLFACGTATSDNLQSFVLLWNTATTAYSQVGAATLMNSVRYASKLVSDSPRSNYIFYLVAWSQPTRVRRWDHTTAAPGAETITPSTDASLSMQVSQDTLVVYGSAGTTITFVNRQDLTLARSVTGARRAIQFLIDNSELNIFYITQQQTPFGVARLSLATSTYAVTHTIPGQGGREQSDMVDLLRVGYLALIRRLETNYPLRLYFKSDLSLVQPPTFTALYMPSMVANSLTSGPSFENDFTFGIQVENPTGVFNFQKWLLKNELCLSRVNSVCRICTSGYYVSVQDVAGNTCLPLGQGKSLATGVLTPCSDTSCSACGADHTKCTKCDPLSTKPYLYEARCVDLAGIPSKFGVNTADNTVVGCSDKSCNRCFQNIKVCTECNTEGGVRLVDGLCVLEVTPPLRNPKVKFEEQDQSALVTFYESVKVVGQLNSFNITVQDSVKKLEYSCQDLGCTIIAQENGLSIVFNTTKVILKGEITIHRTPGVEITRTEDGRAFTNYPIRIPDLIFFSYANSPQHRAFRVLTRVAEIIKLPGQLCMAYMAPSLTPLIDNISMKSIIYAFFHGSRMFYADLSTVLLIQTRNWLVPVRWNTTAPELPPMDDENSDDMQQRLGIAPTFVGNMEPDLWQVLFFTLFCIIVKGVVTLLNRKKEMTPTWKAWTRVFDFMDARWGLMLFAAKIDGNMLGYLTYAFLDLKHSAAGSSTTNTGSTVCAAMFLAFVMGATFLSGRVMWGIKQHYNLKFWQENPKNGQDTEAQQKEKEKDQEEERTKDSQEIINLDTIPQLSSWYIKPWHYLYAGDTVPKNVWYLMAPQLLMLKQIAVVLVLVLDPSPTSQCLWGLVLEMLALYFVCCFSNRSSKWVGLAEKLLQCCWVLVLIGKYISHYYVADVLQSEMSNLLFATQIGLQAYLIALSGVALLLTLYKFARCQGALLIQDKKITSQEVLPESSEENRLESPSSRNKQAATTLKDLAKPGILNVPLPQKSVPRSISGGSTSDKLNTVSVSQNQD